MAKISNRKFPSEIFFSLETMVKFKVLKYHEYVLFKLGIFQNHFPQKPINGFLKSPIIYYNLFVSTTFIVSSTVYAYQSDVEFKTLLRACLFTIGTIQATAMFVSFGLNSSKIQAVHLKLQELVDTSHKGK